MADLPRLIRIEFTDEQVEPFQGPHPRVKKKMKTVAAQ